jgi:hypothetical protein
MCGIIKEFNKKKEDVERGIFVVEEERELIYEYVYSTIRNLIL